MEREALPKAITAGAVPRNVKEALPMHKHFLAPLFGRLLAAPAFWSFSFLGNPVSNYGIAAAILLAAFLLRKVFARLIQTAIRLFHWKNESAGGRLSVAALPGLQLMLVAIGFSAATSPLLLTVNVTIARLLEQIGSTLYVIVICLLLAGVATALTEISYDRSVRHEKPTSAAIHQFYRQAIRAGAVILGLFMILKVWGFDISSLLTGIGIGGLALSLAAQETFSNLLGGITIMADRAFEIGDYIATPDIEGIVEEIGFRSSRIRTFTQAVVTVPNAKLSNSFITNYSRMGKRRIRFHVSIAKRTPVEKISLLTERLRGIAENRDSVLIEGELVFLEQMSDNSLDILFQCFVNKVDYSQYLAEQQSILLDVIRCLEELDIDFSFPTTTVTLQQKEAEAPAVKSES